MKWLWLLAAVMLLSACEKGVWQLEDGRLVKCESAKRDYCGLTLYGCDDGVSYECQTNVRRLK